MTTPPTTPQPRPRRDRGRPAKYAGQQESGRRIMVGFPADLLAELTAAAAAAGHSREDEIRHRCQVLRTDQPEPTVAAAAPDDEGQERDEDVAARLVALLLDGLARTGHRDAVLADVRAAGGDAAVALVLQAEADGQARIRRFGGRA